MRQLWPHEPGRSRAEFARLLRESRNALDEGVQAAQTPDAGPVSEAMAKALKPDDPAVVLGTPYKLLRKIGEGASGVVWEAEHVELGRHVALKVLAPEHAASAAALERFRREARAVAKLAHPNLVQILDFGKSLDGRVYLAMELLTGETLDAALDRGPVPWREAVRVASKAATALSVAHAAGLVHRDIKPQNLFLTSAGDLKLLDFGVATALTQGSDRKPTEKERALRGFAIFGTPEYMAPEQVAGDAVDGRTDVYALGCVLYEMLTGTRAFDGPSSVVVMGKQLRDTPLPPRVQARARAIPVVLDAIVMRAIRKDPAERYPSAAALREALEEATAAPARRWAHAKRAASTLAFVGCLVGAAVASAQWARTHADAADAPVAGAQPSPPTPAQVAIQAPLPAAVALAPLDAPGAAPMPTPEHHADVAHPASRPVHPRHERQPEPHETTRVATSR
jgi:serine/threonine-protein kinase